MRRPVGDGVPFCGVLRRRTALLVVLGLPLAFAVMIGTAWAVDLRAASGEVVRNTSLAGTPVGGFERAQLRRVVAAVDERYRGAAVRVVTPEGPFELQSSELDLQVDQEATVEAALQIGRTGAFTSRAAGWARSLVAARDVPVVIDVDEWQLRQLVAERDPTREKDPVEPAIEHDDGDLVAVDGKDGRGIDPDAVMDALRDAAAKGEVPLVVELEPGPVPPQFPDAAAERLAERAEAVSSAPLDVQAGDVSASVPIDTLRKWLRAVPTRDGLALAVDPESSTEDLADLLPEAGTDPIDARFEIRGGVPIVIRGRTGTACCAETAAPLVLEAIVNRRSDPVALPLKSIDPELTSEKARGLGIEQPVGEFTTNYRAGEARVGNIHRIADLLRGVVVQPGKTFSVNEFVGRRTRENGFVPAGVIYEGEFTEDVGGGISQFATTMFNALFFSGLEFEEYQSHSIYISRYPYGREATLSYPKPDLVFRNDSPYGVLVWTGYTDDSITVTLWSTEHLEAVQSGQRAQPVGPCTRVTTERTITNLENGEREVDRVFALYRPGEGVNC